MDAGLRSSQGTIQRVRILLQTKTQRGRISWDSKAKAIRLFVLFLPIMLVGVANRSGGRSTSGVIWPEAANGVIVTSKTDSITSSYGNQAFSVINENPLLVMDNDVDITRTGENTISLLVYPYLGKTRRL